VIRVCDEAGNVIETHEQVGDFKEPWKIASTLRPLLDSLTSEFSFNSISEMKLLALFLILCFGSLALPMTSRRLTEKNTKMSQ